MDIIKTYLDTVFKDFLDNYNLICFPLSSMLIRLINITCISPII